MTTASNAQGDANDKGFHPGPLDLLFGHQRADGASERLILAGGLCWNPECPCRDISYYGYVIPGEGTEDLVGRNLGERALEVHLNQSFQGDFFLFGLRNASRRAVEI